jgi:hypothetical protein
MNAIEAMSTVHDRSRKLTAALSQSLRPPFHVQQLYQGLKRGCAAAALQTLRTTKVYFGAMSGRAARA